MKITSVFSTLLAASGIALVATSINPATATVVQCSTGAVTLNGQSYTSCAGPIDGNNAGNGSDENLLNKLNSGDPTSLFLQVGTFDFTQYTWNLSYSNEPGRGGNITGDNLDGGTSGTWNITGLLSSPFAIALKGGPGYSVYFFENLTAAASSGTWNTLGLGNGNGGKGPGLSHIDIYTTTSTPVPEPITMLGLAVGTVGLGALKRKYGKKETKEKAAV